MAHRMWSGHAGVGATRALGWLFAGGGLAGGILLGLAFGKEGPNQQSWAGGLGLLGTIIGYIVCLFLVRSFGRWIAPRRAECTCMTTAVQGEFGSGTWQFRFTNPRFEDAFRSMNRGF